ncbi:MAG: hypothetical protein IJV17_02290 [Prevotella sp.]|nr:hypothetical protein [Prevotella sp.]MBQ9216257.1 hypothetical protein [Prevotella sp.]
MMTCSYCLAGGPIDLDVGIIDPSPIGHQTPKAPVRPPVVYIEDYTLLFGSNHPEYVLNIKDEDDDAYFLDGKRLILSSGTEGADGAVYAPEGNALTLITMHNSGGTIWFEANTTDGMRYEYGRTSAERQEFTLGGMTVSNAWYLSKTENPVGMTGERHQTR